MGKLGLMLAGVQRASISCLDTDLINDTLLLSLHSRVYSLTHISVQNC